MMVKPVNYKQGDVCWGSDSYAVDGEKSTIKSAGCGPTSLADVLASIVSPYIDPLTCASWSRMKGYKVYKSGTSYGYPVAQGAAYGVEIRRLNTSSVYGDRTAAVHTQALSELHAGNWLIACMGKGLWTDSGHFIVVYGYEGGMVYINDPASSSAKREYNTWELFSSQVKYYWAVEVPDKIKRDGIVKDGVYRQEDFVRECQMCLKAGIDGIPGSQTLSKTITVSRTKNRKNNVVFPLQKKLKSLRYYMGKLDRIAGRDFEKAVNRYQKEVLKYKKQDGEITARGRMWKSLLNG